VNIAVLMKPGQSALTATFMGPISSASACVNEMTAAFEAQ
jgi:hypothetical protein